MTTPTHDHTHPARGWVLALASAAILSTTAIFIRHLTETYRIPPLVLAFWRDLFVVVTLLPVLGVASPGRLRIARRHLAYLAAYGLLLAIFNAFWTMSVALNGAAVSTVLVYCSAAFTALLGWWLLGEPLGWAKLVAIAVSLGGCLAVAGAHDPAAWRVGGLGISTGLMAGLLYAAYSVMGRWASQRGLDPWTTLLYTFAFATVFLLIVNLGPTGLLPGTARRAADFLWLGTATGGWLVLFLLAAGPTVAGFGLYNVSLSLLPSSVANLILTSEPVFTAATAYMLLGERLSPTQLAGAVSTLAGVAFLRAYEARPRASSAGAGACAVRRPPSARAAVSVLEAGELRTGERGGQP
jgi:drug/metabolite transporter (DMT)-like permease